MFMHLKIFPYLTLLKYIFNYNNRMPLDLTKQPKEISICLSKQLGHFIYLRDSLKLRKSDVRKLKNFYIVKDHYIGRQKAVPRWKALNVIIFTNTINPFRMAHPLGNSNLGTV